MPTANQLIKTSSNKLFELYRRLGIPDREKRQFDDLCDRLAEYLDKREIDDVRRSYEISADAHEGQRRLKGEKYINHPLAVAELLVGLKLDSHTIMAAILHDTLEDTDVTRELLEREFGEDVTNLVVGVSKVTGSEFKDKEDEEAENLRRLLVAAAGDIRVILIKLADRMHNLATLDVHRLVKRERIVRQTREIYIPMTYMMGMYEWHRELEDLCFRAIYPDRYRTIARSIRKTVRSTASDSINRHVKTITDILRDQGIPAEVAWREKNVAAIHEKMRRKRDSHQAVSFAVIKDLVGFRVVLDSEDDCYRALGIIHRQYMPISREFNDYIAMPKINGYRSLHTSVYDDSGRILEIQIRTHEMHNIAEYGIASHLSYKTKVKPPNIRTLDEIPWLKDLLDHSVDRNEVGREFLENLKRNLFFDSVFVITPQGDLKRLKKGATVIDFAYAVHTELGHQVKTAAIGGERVPLHTVLEDGDQVEITKKAFGKPDPRWEKFVVTAKAKMAIRRALKDKSAKDYVRMGERLFKNELKSQKIKSSTVTDEMKENLAKKLHLDGWPMILHEIGNGNRFAPVIVNQLFSELSSDAKKLSKRELSVSIDGTEGIVVQYAKCCNPIPNDSIVGFWNAGGGIVIHIADCNNVRFSKLPPDRWQKFYWTDKPEGVYRVAVRVDAEDRSGLLGHIATQIASLNANIGDCRIVSHVSTSVTLEFDIDVTDRVHLAQIMRKIKKVQSVFHIQRYRLV